MFSLTGKERTLAEKFTADPYFTGDEITRRLYAGMEKLPPKQKVVFAMRYFDQMKFEDIAKTLKGTVGSIKASYHHAFIKMKRYLNEED
jgi:RNA polymerase sigma-70 factor (ECF subfamily)